MGYGFKIIVEGDYACFTRPELKVERVSYDVPTPGALEGMLKSVYWKPAIRYVIDKIIVFQEIDFANIRTAQCSKKSDETERRRSLYLYFSKQKSEGSNGSEKSEIWYRISL